MNFWPSWCGKFVHHITFIPHQTWKNDREHITKQISGVQLSTEVGQTTLSSEKEKKHNGEIEADRSGSWVGQ